MPSAWMICLRCPAAPSVDGEGSSGAIKEGWVTGVPVICSALPSNQELVRGDENGLLAAVGDPVSLADAMARCLTDEALRVRLAEAGSRAGVHRYPDG